jgi:hypothetical protein
MANTPAETAILVVDMRNPPPCKYEAHLSMCDAIPTLGVQAGFRGFELKLLPLLTLRPRKVDPPAASSAMMASAAESAAAAAICRR